MIFQSIAILPRCDPGTFDGGATYRLKYQPIGTVLQVRYAARTCRHCDNSAVFINRTATTTTPHSHIHRWQIDIGFSDRPDNMMTHLCSRKLLFRVVASDVANESAFRAHLSAFCAQRRIDQRWIGIDGHVLLTSTTKPIQLNSGMRTLADHLNMSYAPTLVRHADLPYGFMKDVFPDGYDSSRVVETVGAMYSEATIREIAAVAKRTHNRTHNAVIASSTIRELVNNADYVTDTRNWVNVPRNAQWLLFDEVTATKRLPIADLKMLTGGSAAAFAGNCKKYGERFSPRADVQLLMMSNRSIVVGPTMRMACRTRDMSRDTMQLEQRFHVNVDRRAGDAEFDSDIRHSLSNRGARRCAHHRLRTR